jgi:hypothetical protein
MSIISEILQKADFQATIKAFIALFMDFNRPWQAGHLYIQMQFLACWGKSPSP